MNRKFKLLPVTMFAVLMLLAIRTADLIRGGEYFSHMLLVGNVAAEDTKPAKSEDAKPETAKEAPKSEADAKPPADTAKDAAKPAAEKPKEGEAKESAPKEGDAKEGEEKKEGEDKKEEGGEGEGAKKKDKGNQAPKGHISTEPPKEEEGAGKGLSAQARYFSPIELDILQNLNKRREQLNGWDKEVEMKENLLSNVEKRIDEKLAQIQDMKKALDGMLIQYNEQEDAKIRSLVKIYENMKPRDAARIFDEVEMPILLLVIDRMAEKKAAPILASMDSKKAKQVTVELAEQRRLNLAKMPQAPAQPVAPPPANR